MQVYYHLGGRLGPRRIVGCGKMRPRLARLPLERPYHWIQAQEVPKVWFMGRYVSHSMVQAAARCLFQNRFRHPFLRLF